MKNKLFILATLIGLVIVFQSCSDFLDETADKSGNAYIYHMDQLYGLTGRATLYLGGSDMSTANDIAGEFMDEQYYMGDGVSISPDYYSKGVPSYLMQESYPYSIYSWDDYSLKNDALVSQKTWKAAYDRIYTFNTVLENVDKVIQTTPAIRAQVEGEARFGRAFFHFMLLTQYCLWQENTPGIGYREDTNPMTIPERQTVAYTLSRIYEDLDLAEQKLTEAGRIEFDFEFNTRPTVPTVQALRARIALYRGDYETALKNAENALKGNGELIDVATNPINALTPLSSVTFLDQNGKQDISKMKNINFPLIKQSQRNLAVVDCHEIYLPCVSYSQLNWGIPISESFYELFTDKENDARWTFYYDNCIPIQVASALSAENTNGGITWETQQWLKPSDYCSYWNFCGLVGASNIIGMTTAEMYLTKAECLARANRNDEAAEVLRTLRRTRFTNQEAADEIGGSVQEVLDERSREMGPFWRFYEAKRLNGAEDANIGIHRKILENPADPTSVTEITITADDPRWALPFYEMERELMNWEQNEGW